MGKSWKFLVVPGDTSSGPADAERTLRVEMASDWIKRSPPMTQQVSLTSALNTRLNCMDTADEVELGAADLELQ